MGIFKRDSDPFRTVIHHPEPNIAPDAYVAGRIRVSWRNYPDAEGWYIITKNGPPGGALISYDSQPPTIEQIILSLLDGFDWKRQMDIQSDRASHYETYDEIRNRLLAEIRGDINADT
jgi:hypothetical protein